MIAVGRSEQSGYIGGHPRGCGACVSPAVSGAVRESLIFWAEVLKRTTSQSSLVEYYTTSTPLCPHAVVLTATRQKSQRERGVSDTGDRLMHSLFWNGRRIVRRFALSWLAYFLSFSILRARVCLFDSDFYGAPERGEKKVCEKRDFSRLKNGSQHPREATS